MTQDEPDDSAAGDSTTPSAGSPTEHRDSAAGPSAEELDACVAAYERRLHPMRLFMQSVSEFFAAHPTLATGSFPTVHSVKSRLKDSGHLRDKLVRKWNDGREITTANLFDEVTDLSGVRVYHLHLEQFPTINEAIRAQVDDGHWHLHEVPKAYSWDPEARGFFEGLGFAPEIRPTLYTSIHYLVRPRDGSPLCCEVQVRTLFEEIWGEIDHLINYPSPTDSIACREQLRALAKLVGTGGRLVDAILRSHSEHREHNRLRPQPEPEVPASGQSEAP